jgi:hypothetical protein
MSSKNSNMYQQIVDMELQDLENELANIQSRLINDYEVLDEMWVYHPANPNFINPIKAYDLLKKSIVDLEVKLANLELKIKTLKSVN